MGTSTLLYLCMGHGLTICLQTNIQHQKLVTWFFQCRTSQGRQSLCTEVLLRISDLNTTLISSGLSYVIWYNVLAEASNTRKNDIINNAWVNVNNDFWVTREAICQWFSFAYDFHEWRRHEWKSLANRLTSDQTIVIHGNECIILFLTRYFTSWTYNSA